MDDAAAGNDCAGCHNEQRWLPADFDTVDHAATRFARTLLNSKPQNGKPAR